MLSLIFANVRSLISLKSRSFARLCISFAAVCCVICTAYSIMSNLAMFFGEREICEYVIELQKGTSSKNVLEAVYQFDEISNEAHTISVCSPIDIYSAGPIIGVQKAPSGLILDFCDEATLETLGGSSGNILLDYAYIDVWNTIGLDYSEVYIGSNCICDIRCGLIGKTYVYYPWKVF